MEHRYEARLQEMLEDTEVTPEMLKDLLPRLETFVQPFAAALEEPAQRRHAAEYISGLLSNLEHKTGEAIAYLHDQERQGIQKFIGHVPWDHRPLLATLADQVSEQLGLKQARFWSCILGWSPLTRVRTAIREVLYPYVFTN